MMPSPVSLSTRPPMSTVARDSAASTRSVTTPTLSGSRSSAHAVKSERSPNRTVTTRRSAVGSLIPATSRTAPQLWQNRAPGTGGVPHTGQRSGPAGPVTTPSCVQILQLCPNRHLCSRPQHRVHIGVHPPHDRGGVLVAGGHRRPHLFEPFVAVTQIVVEDFHRRIQHRSVPR